MRKKATAAFIIICAAITLMMTYFILASRPAAGSRPEAVNGTMDLTGWSFADNGSVRLDGQWEFYPYVLLTPDDFLPETKNGKLPEMNGYVHVPDRWEHYTVKDWKKSPYGYATFRLHVELPDGAGQSYGIRQTNIKTAHTLFVNGQKLGGRGTPGMDKQGTVSVNSPYVRFFSADGNSLDIIVQVANYRYSQGGITQSIVLGFQEDIQSARESAIAKDLLAASTFLLIGAFFILLFWWVQGRERSWLYFGLSCVTTALYSMTHSEKIAMLPLAAFPYELFTKIQDFSGVSIELFLLLYAKHSYPKLFNRHMMKLFVAAIAARMLLIAATPASVFTYASIVSFALTFLAVLYVIYVMSAGVVRRMDGSVYLLVGTLPLLVMVVLSSMDYLGIPVNFPLQLSAWMGFFLAHGLLLSKRFVNEFAAVRILSERLEYMDHLKDEFLANISHELKTPLHGIINISESLLEEAAGPMTPQQEENVAMIAGVGKRMAHLVGDLLDFSRLKNGELALNQQAIALRPVVRIIFEMFRHLAGDKPVRFIDFLSERHIVYADEDRLTQILNNLVGNALKFTAAGEITVSAREENGWLAISVADTGIGIPSDKLEAIFEAFEQAGDTIAKDYGGTGLGLSIAKRLVELHGGTIRAESEQEQGAVFTFTVPLANEAGEQPVGMRGERVNTLLEAAALQAFPKDTILLEGGGDFTILVVDDDAANRQVLLNLLSVEKYTVIAVSSGSEAIRQLELNRRIDLAVVDLLMPGMSGYEVCRTIRKRYSLSDLPVLLLTARTRPEEMLAAFDEGVNDFLGKPVDASELKARIRTLLKMKTSVSESASNEMAFLQAQIKPHFLYNALNTISAFSLDDPQAARDLLAKLSQYLRGSFDFGNLDRLIPLSKELELVEAYLSIEKARFGERLRIVYDVDGQVHCLLPPIVIQPLVENAVQHGLADRKQGVTVAILVRAAEDHVVITVEDDGVGFEQSLQDKLFRDNDAASSGVALENIQRRLVRVYGHGLDIKSKATGGTTVTIRIPKGGQWM
ncbi:hypothetical protein BC351_39900 [Paenibacillus ferrarius]|uniref:Circadian input-output histidine kinase CikA n=2 Tax=Paenibacillus ferrarius TaxID=1469647 RepID=A0A1V4H886_9BACL|nr:hypothetical protein BC351_39900 [Paenibacillus ferrarius]